MALLYFQTEQAARHALDNSNLEALKFRARTTTNPAERRCLEMKLADLMTVHSIPSRSAAK